MTDTFDLGAVAPLDTITVAAPLPNGAPSTWMWTLAGPAHPATLAANEAAHAAYVEKTTAQRAKAQAALDAGKPVPTFTETLAESRTAAVAMIAPRVLGWSPVTVDGQPLAWSPEAAQDLLAAPRFTWLYVWLQARLAAGVDFFPKPAGHSGDTGNGSSGLDGAAPAGTESGSPASASA